ncbi:MAG TPA: hypothetical protein VFG37_15130 [Planctomycetota bacterium]|jgi:hypothetical protein|nr:hypothetical protein [Planctomycetota bacterium]
MHSRNRRIRGASVAAFASLCGLVNAQETPPQSPPPAAPPVAPAAQDDFSKALDQELGKAPSSANPAKPSTPAAVDLPGGAQLKLLDISLDVLASLAGSTERSSEMQNLQLGDHDPNRRGFRLNQAEISLQGAVDPYFTAEMHLVTSIESDTGDTGVELEEAFFTTSALPYGLQIKGGQYLTEFGRINSTHPHAWDFVDQPVIFGRVFGGDGMRSPGARVSWLAPTPWYSELIVGVQNADGPQMTSFLGNADTTFPGGQVQNNRELRSGGDLMYNARLLQSWDTGDSVVTQFGMSGAVGPNAAGASTGTSILGADLKIKWQPPKNDDGWPFVIWQTEALRRNLGSDTQAVDPDGIPASGDEFTAPGGTTHDTGGYTYLLWGFERDWIAGLRYELATASGPSALPREDDPLRDDRQRISPLLIWQPTHFSRVSLQYNLDFADHLSHDASSIFLRIEFLIGSHPAHKY